MEEKSKWTGMPKNEKSKMMDTGMIQLLQNPENRFLYNPRTNTIHDRQCTRVDAFSAGEVEVSGELMPEYIRGKHFCPQCAQKAAVRNGIRNRYRYSQDQMALCMQFFCTAGAAAEDLIKLFIRNTGSIILISMDCMEIEFNGEKWRLVLTDGVLSLLHNNYTVHEDYSRSFVRGFHVQCRNVPFHMIARTICGYSFKFHEAEYKAAAEKVRSEKFRTILAITDNYAVCKRKSLLFDDCIFVDFGKKTQELAKEESNRWIHITKENEHKGYTVKNCRIPRWKRPDFEKLMHALKDQALTESLYDYPTICEEAVPQTI